METYTWRYTSFLNRLESAGYWRKREYNANIKHYTLLLRDFKRVKGYWIYMIVHKVSKMCIQATGEQ